MHGHRAGRGAPQQQGAGEEDGGADEEHQQLVAADGGHQQHLRRAKGQWAALWAQGAARHACSVSAAIHPLLWGSKGEPPRVGAANRRTAPRGNGTEAGQQRLGDSKWQLDSWQPHAGHDEQLQPADVGHRDEHAIADGLLQHVLQGQPAGRQFRAVRHFTAVLQGEPAGPACRDAWHQPG